METMNTDKLMNPFDEQPYSEYETLFDPFETDRKARRKRAPRVHYQPKVARTDVLGQITDEVGWETDFAISYKPSKYEAAWLYDSLRGFFEQALITDVLSLVQGGKEATVYCCSAHPSLGVETLALKVYRPQMFRALTNDQIYRQGREILSIEGHVVHENQDRIMRAIGKKTTFGRQVSHASWLMHEYQAMQTLFQAGAQVPKPYQAAPNAILMEFIGSGMTAAPMLQSIRLEHEQAQTLCKVVLENIEIMLQNGWIHGDLSAYNILFADGSIRIIDLPQVVNPRDNNHAPAILARDVQRVCDYFANQGVACDAQAIYKDLWDRYLHVPAHIRKADQSRMAQYYPDIFSDSD